MKKLNIVIVSLFALGQAVIASQGESVFTIAGKNMCQVTNDVSSVMLFAGSGIGMAHALKEAQAGNYKPLVSYESNSLTDNSLKKVADLMYPILGNDFIDHQIKSLKRQNIVGDAGETAIWSSLGVFGCAAIVKSLGSQAGAPIDTKVSIAGCAGLYTAFVAAASKEDKAAPKKNIFIK